MVWEIHRPPSVEDSHKAVRVNPHRFRARIGHAHFQFVQVDWHISGSLCGGNILGFRLPF